MGSALLIVGLLVVIPVISSFTRSLAHEKGRNGEAWAVFALITGLIALLIVYLLPPLNQEGMEQ